MRFYVHGVPPLGRIAVRDMRQTVAVGVTKADTPTHAAAVLQRKRLDFYDFCLMVRQMVWKAIGVWVSEVKGFGRFKMIKLTIFDRG